MKRTLSFLMLAIMMMISASAFAAKTFTHPGITYTEADILRMKANIAAQTEPYYSTFQKLTQSGYVGRTPSTGKRTSITSDDDYNSAIGMPGRCALDNALLYRLTNKTSYATKAVAWLNDLSYITTLEGATMALSAGKIELLIEAAELLRDYEGWASADKARLDSMLLNVFYPQLKDFDRARWGNQGLTAARAIMAMAVYLDNSDMYARCYAYLNNESNPTTEKYPLGAPTAGSRQKTTSYLYEYATPTQYGTQEYVYDEALPYYIYDNGQCEESSRDQGHAQYGLNIFGNIAEIAWNQGDNLYGALDNRILLGMEWTYRYNLDTSWAPASYVTSGATFENNGYYKRQTRSKRWYSLKPYDVDRGDDYSTGLNREMILAHYSVRAGLAAEKYTYLKQSVDNLISNYGCEQGDIQENGHYYEFPGWGTLTKRRGTWQVGDPVKNGTFAMHATGEAINFGDIDTYAIGNEGHTQTGVTVSGTAISAIAANGWASYTVNVTEGKTYDMYVTYTSASETSLSVAIDGNAYTNATLAASASQKEAVLKSLYLTPGIHVIRVKAVNGSEAQLVSFILSEQAVAEGAPVLEKLFRTNQAADAAQTSWHSSY